MGWALRVVGLAALTAAGGAQAQDIANGRAIAQIWCSNCHRADPQEQATVRDPAPTFPSIARRETTTAASLAAFLAAPHGQMPNLTLTRKEIRDVSAFILSLRQPR